MEMINAVGRRKASVARVFLKKGKGKITINKKDIKDYMVLDNMQQEILAPLNLKSSIIFRAGDSLISSMSFL